MAVIVPLQGQFSSTNKDSLEQIIAGTSGLERVQILGKFTDFYRVLNPPMAIEFGKRALALSEEYDDAATKAQTLHRLGMVYYLRSDYLDAIDYFQRSAVIRDSIGDLRGYGNSLASIANINNFWGNYYEATDQYYKVLDLRKEINDQRGIATTLINLGSVYKVQGNFDVALDMYLQAITMSDTIGFLEGKAWTYYNMAVLYKIMEEYDRALEYNRQALAIYETLTENLKGVALCLNEFGTIYNAKGESEKSLDYHQRALAIYRNLQDSYGIARTYTDIGNFYFTHGEHHRALEYYDKSFKLRRDINDSLGRIQTLQAIAKTNFAMDRYDLALTNYQVAQEMARKADMLSTMETNYEGMARVYAAKEDFKTAYAFYREFTNIKDSLFSSRVTSRISDLQVKYQTERSRRENELLRKNNEIQELMLIKANYQRYVLSLVIVVVLIFLVFFLVRYRSGKKMNARLQEQKDQLTKALKQLRQREEELEELNATKDRFFSIVSHDLRGPLGGFYRLTETMAREIDNLSHEEIKEAMTGVHQSAEHMYKLLENLLEWSRLQLGKVEFHSETFNLGESVSGTLALMKTQAAQKNIHLDTHLPDTPITVQADTHMLGTIVRNLVSNAIKFTPRGGEVEVIVEKADETFARVTISDNGVGMDRATRSSLFDIGNPKRQAGTENEQGTGLGLILCKELVENHGGTISADSTPNKGSTFQFTLPLA
ncbi:MAG: tetratricopeptide repeat-containing sensor histidine kinase [Candidatus Marinimicrobia bacterium]|nr:tetratricopeptide repeat-containing sensor histidine kinase [Candidatus Neomarinimicrobiota bacterium]MCF7840493.1 tetratricopeptide repeat-containing sensor histidine kinase [Candidatus Neomarinimicrobiota bacterium]